MEYMRGRHIGECFDDLTYLQKIRVGTDLALVMSSLFKIKASKCGSLSRIQRSSIGCLKKPSHALSYPSIDAVGTSSSSHLGGLSDPAIAHHGLYIGPVNDVSFLRYLIKSLPKIVALSTPNVNFWRHSPF